MSSTEDSPLGGLREKITAIDEQLLSLLAERREIVKDVAATKGQHGILLRDKDRENELLSNLIRLGKEKNLESHFILDIYNRIIEDSLQVQQTYFQEQGADSYKSTGKQLKVAHLGGEGSYSYLASDNHFMHHNYTIDHLCCDEFNQAIKLVITGEADVAVLPIENTTSGGINEVYDLLLDCPLHIIGEEMLKVEHCLVAKKETDLSDIDTVIAHPQARAQCIRQLKKLGIDKVEFTNSTAHALEAIKSGPRKNVAALANHQGAAIFDLKVVARDIADQKENYSRFMVLSSQARSVHSSIPCKTTLMIATEQKAGSLVEALSVFQRYGINLTKLESRPILGNPWEEMFYIDLEGNLDDTKVKSAIDGLNNSCRYIKILGCYPSSQKVS